MSQQSVHGIVRYLPYSEEAKDMVYPVSIEVLRHVLESPYPPLTSISNHRLPVVCGEAPVLSIYRKVIWRSTCLSVKVEIARLAPYITTISAHAYRNVTFQYDSLAPCIVVNSPHL